jgi:hypothetical protein
MKDRHIKAAVIPDQLDDGIGNRYTFASSHSDLRVHKLGKSHSFLRPAGDFALLAAAPRTVGITSPIHPRKTARNAAPGVIAGTGSSGALEMAKTSKTKGFDNLEDPEQNLVADLGGATHQNELRARASVGQYIEAAKQQRVWDRKARLSEIDA